MNQVLLLIDVQRNMLLPPEPVPGAQEVSSMIATLLERARAGGMPVVFVRNNGGEDDPDFPGTPGWELVHEVLPGEHVVDKHTPDAFLGTDLASILPPSASLVVAGMQSEWCVRETSLAALGRGHALTLVRGAHATYDGDEAAAAVSGEVERELAAVGVKVVDLEEVSMP
ncbi:isochorismatase family protein [Streptosporangium sp. NPDC087985]|uniref:isochorismatase family protein n=1 Tax=Streptosporangium sp. NPDC087985 TaxID=3366196 RepID=UPI00380EB324